MTSLYGRTGANISPGSSGFGAGDKVPKGYKKGQLQQFTPEQMQLFEQMFGQVSPDSYLSRLAGGDEEMFQQMEAPAMRQFSGQQGNIASRFSGMGGPGSLSSRNSSGFQNTMNSASSNFAQDLQAQRMNYQRQAQQDLRAMSTDLLGQRPYDRFLVEKQQKQGTNWGGLAGGIVGGAVGLAGGPIGAIQGANFGSQVGQAFV